MRDSSSLNEINNAKKDPERNREKERRRRRRRSHMQKPNPPTYCHLSNELVMGLSIGKVAVLLGAGMSLVSLFFSDSHFSFSFLFFYFWVREKKKEEGSGFSRIMRLWEFSFLNFEIVRRRRKKKVGFWEQELKSLRVCLFGGEIGWMENFGEKMGRKTFLKCV